MGIEILDNGTAVHTGPGAAFGTDALLLARFAVPKARDRAADLCSGCGIVALMWHDMGFRGECAAVEIDPAASALCARAAEENDGAAHILPVCGDLRTFCAAGPEQGRYDLVACNPPYFTSGPVSPDARRAGARHELLCTLEDVAACAARCLHDGGRLALCHRPGQLAEVFCTLRAHRLEPKRLSMVKNDGGGAPWLFLLEAQKNRRPGLQVLPDVLVSSGAARYGR